ncbi:LacI family DNA-binding transcriptional regulator [Actinoplanes sp. LDG1-06]|uniref:LacI family DNA-binding transcriptional regulator n=1 Tax=Paractinoplanes ovalisporus TaxID=2810368 RepID=A0ABS2ATK7_9ACTN|nr:LacI family DNA-binding transcriptional regulator [Actinoplanes ovalisporus]MBM2623050.1 LacI family DNA-binding transcriptional regulator [Actinoplanes ovalisporus]
MSRAKPTITDVARRAGVSRSAVSRVMNNEPGASGPVREAVRRAMAELGYVPSQTARALASGRQRAVDVVAFTNGPVIGWLASHPYYSRVLAGVTSALQGTDVQVRVQALTPTDATAGSRSAVDRAADELVAVVDRIAVGATVGAVLTDVPPAIALRFQEKFRRVVSLAATSAVVPTIEADNAGGVYTAVEYLHGLGRRHIAAIHGPASSADARDRRTGYLRAIDRLGLSEISDGGDFRREDGFEAAHRLLTTHPQIDAIVVACDLMAAGVVQAITASGRTVPYDVSVIGFDDSVAAVCANPPLTTMRMPVEEMAVAATRLLLDGAVTPGFRQTFPVELVVRDSTTPRTL